MGKREITIKPVIDAALQTIVWTAIDAEGNKLPNVLTFDAKLASVANRNYAALHGFKQRIGDAAALGQGSSLDEKFSAMAEIVDHLESGSDEWRLKAQAGDTLLVRALLVEAENLGKTIDSEVLRAKVKALSAGQQSALLGSERLSGIVAKLRADAGRGTDTEALLGELGI
jgi:hypothetical protein